MVEVEPAEQGVVVGEPAGQRLGQVADLLAQHAAGQVSQHRRVTLAGDQRFDHRPAGHAESIGGHRVQLDPAVLADLTQPLVLPGAFLDQLASVAGQLADRGDLGRWNEAAAQQPDLAQLREPYRVGGVGLAAGYVLHVIGVAPQHLHPVDLGQRVEDRPPVDPGRLHRHLRDPLVDEPAGHLPQRTVEGPVAADRLPALPDPVPGRAYRHRDLLLVHIDRRDPLVHDLHDGLHSPDPDRTASPAEPAEESRN